MLLTLKNISFSEALSEETNAFTADVYLDGVKRATASNHGQGGPTDVHAHAKPPRMEQDNAPYLKERRANQDFIAQYEAWAAQQPEVVTDLKVEGGSPFTYPHSLEADIDLLMEAWLNAQFAKKEAARVKRLCNTKWAFTLKEYKGKPCDANSFFMIAKRPGELLSLVSQRLRVQHGDNLLEILNEQYV